jgi:hypothetical protein
MAALWLSIVAVYWFIGSAGLLSPWPGYTATYDYLAEGFRAGHLYLPVAVPPELLAQENPFDPVHIRLWFWDASLHGGRFYAYWGPFPALVQAAVKSVFGIDRIVGDQYLVFAMSSLWLVFGALLVERVARRLLPRIPAWLIALGILTFAFSNPAPYLLASAGNYQAAIIGGQAFLLGGLVLAFDAIWAGSSPGNPRLLGAGALWAIALGCRVSLGLAIALLCVTTAIATRSGGYRRVLSNAILMALPVAASLAALLLYNKLRFDQFFEFGTNNQLSTIPWRLSWSYWLPNLYGYLLRPFEATCAFPFVLVSWYPSYGLPSWIPLPHRYTVSEPVVGWLRVVPIAWLCAVPTIWAMREAYRNRRLTPRLSEPEETRARAYAFSTACFLVLATASGIAEMGLYMATMRFLTDVMSGLVLSGLLGAYTLYSAAQRHSARLVCVVVVTGLCGATVWFGLMLGYHGYADHIRRYNPKLDERIVSALSLCPAGPPSAPKARP